MSCSFLLPGKHDKTSISDFSDTPGKKQRPNTDNVKTTSTNFYDVLSSFFHRQNRRKSDAQGDLCRASFISHKNLKKFRDHVALNEYWSSCQKTPALRLEKFQKFSDKNLSHGDLPSLTISTTEGGRENLQLTNSNAAKLDHHQAPYCDPIWRESDPHHLSLQQQQRPDVPKRSLDYQENCCSCSPPTSFYEEALAKSDEHHLSTKISAKDYCLPIEVCDGGEFWICLNKVNLLTDSETSIIQSLQKFVRIFNVDKNVSSRNISVNYFQPLIGWNYYFTIFSHYHFS